MVVISFNIENDDMKAIREEATRRNVAISVVCREWMMKGRIQYGIEKRLQAAEQFTTVTVLMVCHYLLFLGIVVL